jgi:hypothetical protein
MTERPTHDQVAELLGAYALDAVTPEEAELVERHLESCPRCRDEQRGHREVTDVLGAMGGEAPAGLWDQIVAGASEPPPKLRLERVGGATARNRRRTLQVRFVAAAAAVAAAVAVVLGAEVAHLNARTDQLNRTVASMGATPSMRSVHQALATQGSQVVDLTSLAATGHKAEAVVMPSGQGYLYDANLDPLPPNRTYQLWGLIGGQRISYGLLGGDPSSVLAFRAGPGVQSLAITDEVAGGVVTSTQPAVVVGALNPSTSH